VCGGGGSAAVSCRVVSALTAIRGRAAQDGDTVTFADGSDRVEAAAVAGAADVAIVFGYYTESEGLNRTSFSLDGSGDALISTVAAANPRTAVVLETGGPTLMPWNAEVRSIVEAWYPGVEAGPAIAAALFGDVNPSGHLPQTFPASANEVPTAGAPLRHNDVSPVEDYSEGLEVGYRWYDAQHLQPLYPFGYGLSYASYEFDGPHVARQGSGVDLSFRVTNTGQYDGATVAQVYVSDPPAAGEPPSQLAAFRRVFLRVGASTVVHLTVRRRAFAHWVSDSPSSEVPQIGAAGRWVVTPGSYTLLIGDQSRGAHIRASFRL